MTRWAWTGSRGPLTAKEIARVAVDVVTTVKPGDEVATGGCRGVDEVVLATALLLRPLIGLSVVTWPADGERSWEQTRCDIKLLRECMEIGGVRWREKGWGYLERDRVMVDSAEFVRAMPLHDFKRTPAGHIAPERGSGTNYTARRADEQGKLVAIIPLRDGVAWYAPGFTPQPLIAANLTRGR
jgi:hypothetical protein